MNCPKCNSDHVMTTTVSNTVTTGKTKGFGWIKACLGYLLFSIPGILCGLCGFGKRKSTTSTQVSTVFVCQNCGHRF